MGHTSWERPTPNTAFERPARKQNQKRKTSRDQSSIPSQPASASKDDHSCTMQSWSDTALSWTDNANTPPTTTPRTHRLRRCAEQNSTKPAGKQAVSLRNWLCQQGKRFLYHRGDERTLLASSGPRPISNNPDQSSTSSIHHPPATTNHQSTDAMSLSRRLCQRGKRFLYRSKNSRTLRRCLPPSPSHLHPPVPGPGHWRPRPPANCMVTFSSTTATSTARYPSQHPPSPGRLVQDAQARSPAVTQVLGPRTQDDSILRQPITPIHPPTVCDFDPPRCRVSRLGPVGEWVGRTIPVWSSPKPVSTEEMK